MILAAELAGAFLGGAACACGSIYFYARHVFRTKLGQLAGQLTGARPPAPGGYLAGVERKAQEGGGCGS